MSRHLRATCIIAALLATFGATPVASAKSWRPRQPKRCKHPGESVIRRGLELEVVARKYPSEHATIAGDDSYVCVFATKRRTSLGGHADAITTTTLRTAGPYVAYETTSNDGPDEVSTLYLREPTKRRLFRVDDPGLAGPALFKDILLTKQGNLGYIRLAGDYAGVLRCQPAGCGGDPRGRLASKPEPLATQVGLDDASLRRIPGGMDWVRDGKRETASMP